MDNVLVDFMSGVRKVDGEIILRSAWQYDSIAWVFSLMDPVPGWIESYNRLLPFYEIIILSSAPWHNPSAWSDKLLWIQHYLGESAKKKLILSHRKDLAKWDYLVDDRLINGASEFEWKFIHFGSQDFPDWNSVTTFLLNEYLTQIKDATSEQ